LQYAWVYSQELVCLDILQVAYITQNSSVIDSNQIDRTGMINGWWLPTPE
jgi:hypothetical protein